MIPAMDPDAESDCRLFDHSESGFGSSRKRKHITSSSFVFLETWNIIHIFNLRKRRGDDTSPRPKGDTKLNQPLRHPPPSGAEVIR